MADKRTRGFQEMAEEVEELAKRGREAFEDISGKSVEFYDDALRWIERNSRSLLALGLGVAAAGILTFILGRGRPRAERYQGFDAGPPEELH